MFDKYSGFCRGKNPNFLRLFLAQQLRAVADRGAGRDNIINQQNALTGEISHIFSAHKRAGCIFLPLRGGQPCLLVRAQLALEHRNIRNAPNL